MIIDHVFDMLHECMNDGLLGVHVVGYITSVTLQALRRKYFHPIHIVWVAS